jgi:DnaK suppressor protein
MTPTRGEEVEMTRKKTVADRERYSALKALLEDRRREIQEKLRSLRETLPAEASDVRDAEEQSVDDFIQEVDFALMQMKSETLSKIDEAIHRLETGSYGRCAECENEISEARLKALPFAEFCRDCQEREESRVADERVQESRLQRDFAAVR